MDNTQILTIALASVPNVIAVMIGILINNARLGDTNARIGDLRHYMDMRFDQVDQKFDQIDRRFDEVKELWRSELHRETCAFNRVVRVDKEDGGISEQMLQGSERFFLIAKSHSPRMRSGARYRNPKTHSCFGVARSYASGEVSCAACENAGCRRVGAATAKLNYRPSASCNQAACRF